jgi:hypothetical protein
MDKDYDGVLSWLQRPSDIAAVEFGPLVLISRWAATHIVAVDIQPISSESEEVQNGV